MAVVCAVVQMAVVCEVVQMAVVCAVVQMVVVCAVVQMAVVFVRLKNYATCYYNINISRAAGCSKERIILEYLDNCTV
jgi:hypothetical protein